MQWESSFSAVEAVQYSGGENRTIYKMIALVLHGKAWITNMDNVSTDGEGR